MTTIPTYTPWGTPYPPNKLGEGVYAFETPSHGGIWLDAERNAQVPAEWRAASFDRQGQAGWYEEDCDWAFVALTFPHLFAAAVLEDAYLTFEHSHAKKIPSAVLFRIGEDEAAPWIETDWRTFKRDNAQGDFDIDAVAADLVLHGVATLGGGASPVVEIRRV